MAKRMVECGDRVRLPHDMCVGCGIKDRSVVECTREGDMIRIAPVACENPFFLDQFTDAIIKSPAAESGVDFVRWLRSINIAINHLWEISEIKWWNSNVFNAGTETDKALKSAGIDEDTIDDIIEKLESYRAIMVGRDALDYDKLLGICEIDEKRHDAE